MQIKAAFDGAADYDRHATVQRRVAARLADHILSLALPPRPRVLEIGCGTGFLGQGLLDRLDHSQYLMTDIAPAMVERARRRFAGRSDIVFVTLDGATPDIEGPFDLICSSLAMQWVDNLPAAVVRLRGMLSREGRLAFTTLAAGTFAGWRRAYAAERPGTPDYPTAAELTAMGLQVTIEIAQEKHANARDFLRTLKGIGAGTPRPGYRPLVPAAMRRVMDRFEQDGAVVDYVVATCTAGA